MFTHSVCVWAWPRPVLTCLVMLVCYSSCVKGSAISFQSSATSVKPLISSNMTITCLLHDTVGPVVGRSLDSTLPDDVTNGEDTRSNKHNSNDLDDSDDISKKSLTQTTENVQFVTSIMISRDGKDIATISEHFPARQVGGASGFQVSGQLPGTSSDKGRLDLVWPHPTYTEIGSYECNIDTLSSRGHTFMFSESLEVTEEDVSLKDLVNHVHFLQLEKEEMMKSEQTMKTEIANLTMTLDALRHEARVEPKVFFSTLLTTAQTILVGQVVVYDKVFTNEGSSYNSTTGTFQSPVHGFYHFEIHAYSIQGRDAWLMLTHNGNDVIALENFGDDNLASSNSVTLELVKGDVVKVIGIFRTSSLQSSDRIYYMNTFSGHLIALA